MEVKEYIANLKQQILESSNFQPIELSKSWAQTFPDEAGVYVLMKADKIVYVGETGNLKGRMLDLTDSRHHSVRRTLGKLSFMEVEGYITATIKNKFPAHIEILLDNHLKNDFLIAHLVVLLGRKELEEEIEKEIQSDIKLNKRGKRIPS